MKVKELSSNVYLFRCIRVSPPRYRKALMTWFNVQEQQDDNPTVFEAYETLYGLYKALESLSTPCSHFFEFDCHAEYNGYYISQMTYLP